MAFALAKRLASWTSDSATNLAVFRITVATVVVLSADVHEAPSWALLADAYRQAPLGLAWIAGVVPISITLVVTAKWVLLVSAALTAVGAYTRPAALTAAITSLYVLGVPQLSGAVIHSHHLTWFLFLLAASPCGDALSLDRRWGRAAAGPPGREYGVPLRAAWLLLGLVFFFPALWKLRASGLAWSAPDMLLGHMEWKAAQLGRQVPDVPCTLLRFGGLATLLVELGAPVLVLFRRTRILGVALLLLFHAATQLLTGIVFSSLWACYTVFFDWSRLRRSESFGRTAGAGWSGLIIAGMLLGGQIVTGILGAERAWPFACYPTFRRAVGGEMPALAAEAVLPDGARAPIEPLASGAIPPRLWGSIWAARGGDPTRLEAVFAHLASAHPTAAWAQAREVHFYDAPIAVGTRRPVARRLLVKLVLRGVRRDRAP